MKLEHMFDVAGLLWPFVATGCVAAIRWKRLRSRLGFLVLGVLGCFGLQALLARFARYAFWTYVAERAPQSTSPAVHVTDPVVIILVSALVSVPLLLWLTALVGMPPTSDERGSER